MDDQQHETFRCEGSGTSCEFDFSLTQARVHEMTSCADMKQSLIPQLEVKSWSAPNRTRGFTDRSSPVSLARTLSTPQRSATQCSPARSFFRPAIRAWLAIATRPPAACWSNNRDRECYCLREK